MKNKKIIAILVILVSISLGLLYCSITKSNQDKSVSKTNVTTYSMSQNDIESLPTNVIDNATIQDEQNLETESIENESFEQQGNISYDGDTQYSNINLGDYTGLTYYSQTDRKMAVLKFTALLIIKIKLYQVQVVDQLHLQC